MRAWLGCGSIQDLPSDQLLNQYARLPQQVLEGFVTKPFVRFASRERIADEELCEAVRRAERGLIDADLGGGVIKQRLARAGQGKSGGFRSILLFRRGSKAFFVYGFARGCGFNQRSKRQGFFFRTMMRVGERSLAG